MVRHTDADDGIEFDHTAPHTSVRNAEVDEGDTVFVAFSPEDDVDTDHVHAPTDDVRMNSDAIVGTVGTVYGDHKFTVVVDGDDGVHGTAYLINADTDTVRFGNHADGFEDVDARAVFVDFPAEDDDTETLVFDNTVHGAHEKTGKKTSTTTTKRHDGEVYQSEGGLIGFRSPDFDGVFFVLPDGTVEYDPHDPNRSRYEVGTNGRIED